MLLAGITCFYVFIHNFDQFDRDHIIIAGITFICGLISSSKLFSDTLGKVKKSIHTLLKIELYVFFSFSIMLSVSLFINLLWNFLTINTSVLFYIGTILYLILSIPGFFSLVVFEKNTTLRLFACFLFYYLMTQLEFSLHLGNKNMPQSPTISPYEMIAFFTATLLFLLAIHEWGYRFPRLKLNRHLNYWWLILFILPRFLLTGLSAGSWSHLFTFPPKISVGFPPGYDSVIDIILYMISMFFTTAVFEELIFRFLFQSPVLDKMTGTIKMKVTKTMLISASLFAAWHLTNVSSQSTASTLLQVFNAFGMGLILSIICLYTGTIWITILMHAVFDLIAVNNFNNYSPFSGQLRPFTIEFCILSVIIQVIIVVLALKNIDMAPFKQSIRENRWKV